MSVVTKIPYLTVTFRNAMSHRDIHLFRGAVLSKVPSDFVLFHNHVSDGFRYSYPLIQYKVVKGHAAIVCIGEGTEEIARLFQSQDFNFRLGDREELFEVDSVYGSTCVLQIWDNLFKYKISGWLPLNSENYARYMKLEGVIERTQMLEDIMKANILSMLKGLGKHVDSEVKCRIIDIHSSRIYHFKNVMMQGFDVDFSSNVFIPNYFGLGKGTSLGFGVVKQNSNTI